MSGISSGTSVPGALAYSMVFKKRTLNYSSFLIALTPYITNSVNNLVTDESPSLKYSISNGSRSLHCVSDSFFLAHVAYSLARVRTKIVDFSKMLH